MATRVTGKQYSDVFKLMHQMTPNSSKKTHEDLLQLQETTNTVFKETKDKSHLYTGVKTAIEILSKEKYPEANYQILLAVARKTSNTAIQTCALQNAVTAFLKYDEWNEALVAAKEIPDDDERDQAICIIIKRMIETEDLQTALDTIEEDDISDSEVREELCAEIVTKFIEMEGKADTEIALRAADHASSSMISANLVLFFAKEKKMNQAMEALGEIQNLELMTKTLIECARYVTTANSLEIVLDFISVGEHSVVLNIMEKFATALIDYQKMAFAMEVIDCLAKGGEVAERVSKTLANICHHFIAKNHTAYIVNIAGKIIELMEAHKSKGKPLLLAIIKSLNANDKPTIATKVQRLLENQ